MKTRRRVAQYPTSSRRSRPRNGVTREMLRLRRWFSLGVVFLITLFLSFSPAVFPSLFATSLMTSWPKATSLAQAPDPATQPLPSQQVPIEDLPSPAPYSQPANSQPATSQPATSQPTDPLRQATQQLQLGQYREAVITLTQLLGTKPPALVAAAAEGNLALAYQELSQPQEANQAIARALSILNGLPSSPSKLDSINPKAIQAQTLDIQATLQIRQGQADAALRTSRQAEALYLALKDSPRLWQNRINQAQALKALGSFAEARRLLEALDNTLKTEPDSPTKARTLRLLGDTFQERGDLTKARELLSRSQEIAETQALSRDASYAAYSLALADRAELTRTQTDETLRATSSNSEDAIATLTQQTLNRFQRVEELSTDPVLKIQAQLNQLELRFARLKHDSRRLPDLSTALQRPSTAKTSPTRPTRPASPADLPSPASPPSPLTLTPTQQTQLTTTLDNLAQTLQLLQTLPSAIAQLPLSRTTTYARINLAHQLTQLPAIAPELLTKLPRQSLPPRSQPPQGKQTSKPPAAQSTPLNVTDPAFQALLKRAIALGQTLSQRSATAPNDAAQLLAQAIQDATQLQDARAEVSAKQNLGSLYFQASQNSQDPQNSPAGSTPEATRSKRREEARRLIEAATLKADAIGAYEVSAQGHWQLAQIARESGDTTQAIAACDAALNRNQSIRSDLVTLDRDVQYTFRDSIDPVYRGCADIELKQAKPNYEKVRQILEDLQLAELHDYFREACIQGQIIKLDDIISRKTNSNTAVLYSVFLRDQLQVYAKLPGQSDLIPNTIAIDRVAFQSLLQQWLTQLQDAQGARDVEATGQRLYRLLIQPFEEKFQAEKIDTLVFVNDGPLRNVPMAALFDGQNYLIERYAIAVSPGLQLFAPKSLNPRSLSTLAGGLIDLPTQYNLTNLKSTDAIVSGLDKLGLLNQQPLLESAFTKSAFKEQLQNRPSPIVHLSTHASFSSQLNNLERSFVLMADGKVNLLEMSDLIRERDRASNQPLELLVLGACKTAEGDNRANLGLSGLAIRSGARSTVGSLWGVYDDLSATLLEDFYQALSQGESRAKALQLAQRQAIKTLRRKNDLNSNWAAYVLIGNWL